jgi:hypothetical protein
MFREVCSVKREKKVKFSPVTQCSKVSKKEITY